MNENKRFKEFQNPCEEDEIDLYELFMILRKRWKKVLLFPLLFVFISLIYLIFANPKYKSKGFLEVQNFYCSYNNSYNNNTFLTVTSPNAVKELINYLGSLVKNHKMEKLENIFGHKLVSDLISVEAKVNRKNPNLVKVEIIVTNPEIIGKVFEKVYNFVKNYYQEDLKKLKNEISKYLNSLKTQIEDLKKLKEKFLKDGLYKDVLKVSEKIVILSEKYYNTKMLLENFRGVKVILKPTKPERPYFPKPKLILVSASVSGLFLGIFWVFFMEWWEESKRRYERKNY